MKKITFSLIISLTLLAVILSACNMPVTPMAAVVENSAPTEAETKAAQAATEVPALAVEPVGDPTDAPTPEVTQDPTLEPTEAVTETQPAAEEETQPAALALGPTDFPEGINPLTGLPADPDLLALPPALISVSNFPASARPQAGLNTSPIVYEIYIGEGMTRFLAMFYGDFPSFVSGQTEGQGTGSSTGGGEETAGTTGESTAGTAGEMAAAAGIGPVRSGRLPYEDIRSIYSGFLVMASADRGVAQSLSGATTIYGSDSSDINSAMIGVDRLYDIALASAEGYPGSNFNLDGMTFATMPPEGGQTADKLWVFYSSLNQIQWQYDETLGAYVRYDIRTDGSGEFVMSTDRLTGEPLTRENVLVIFANHDFRAPTLIDINLTNMPPIKALLLRDGEVHEIFWTTRFGEYEQQTGLLRPMRFVDANGNDVPLKPGRSWFEVVTMSSFYVESLISDYPFTPIKEAEGTGLWLVRFKGLY